MKSNLFSFPPDENFDEQWQSFHGSVQDIELNGRQESLNILSYYLDSYKNKLLNHHPPFIEEASKIDNLSALVMRASEAFYTTEL